MPWVRIDDHFDEHPKIAALSDSAIALFVSSLCYCNRNLTDGFVPVAQAGRLPGASASEELLCSKLWEPAPGGYQVHHYAEYQPSRETVMAEREAAKERMREHRMNHPRSSSEVRQNFSRSSVNPDPDPDPDPVSVSESDPKPKKRQHTSAVVATPAPAATWPEDLLDVRSELERLELLPLMDDPIYWRGVDDWLGPEDSGVAYLVELRKYAVWRLAQNGRKKHKNPKRGFREWLSTSERMAQRESQRAAIYKANGNGRH